MRDALRAGIAIYNDGHYHAAHDAWEGRWLELERGTADERLLHGLIQFTAAIHHAHGRNWVGAQGLAESACGYLDRLPADYHGLDLDAIRSYCSLLGTDPETIERGPVPVLTYEGEPLDLDDLRFEPAAIAARVVAAEHGSSEERGGSFDEETIERAIDYARADLDAGNETSPFVTLVMDFAQDDANRAIAYQRIVQHVERRSDRDDDVEGLFD